MLTKQPFKRADLLLLVIVVLTAGALRLGRIGVVSFQYDEALISQNVLDMLHNRDLPLTGQPTSVGIPASPMSLYVLAIPFAVSSSPLIATAFIALINTLAVGLLFVLAQRYVNRTVATVAGLAYAVNPWAILYSRKIWEPNLFVPLLELAMVAGLYGYLEADVSPRRRMWAQVVFWPVLLAGIQIHFSAWTLLPVFLLVVAAGRRQITRRATSVGIMLGLAVLVPFAVGLVQSYRENPIPFESLGDDGGSWALHDDALRTVAHNATGTDLLRLIGFASDVAGDLAAPDALWAIIGGLALVGVLGVTVRAWRVVAAGAVLWVALPLIVFTPDWTHVTVHYFVQTLPALSLLVGLGVGWLVTRIPDARGRGARFAQGVVIAGAVALLATQGAWWWRLIDRADSVSTTGDLNRPLARLIDVADRLADYDRVVVVSNAYWQEYNKEPQVWRVLLRESAACVRAIGSDGMVVLPEGPFAVLTTPKASAGAVNDLYLADGRVTVEQRAGEGAYTIDYFDDGLAWTGPALTPIEPVMFDNGIQLTGYALDGSQLYLGWWVLRSGGKNFQYFAHFLDANGDKLAQRDTTFVPGTYRCARDRVITWTAVDVPPETVTLRVGMYNLWLDRAEGPFYPASTIDASGQVTGRTVDIPLER